MKINMMELSKFVKWSVAGDGYVGRSTHNLDAHYAITRLEEYKDYIDLIANKIDSFGLVKVNVDSLVRKDTGKRTYTVRTGSHPLFSRVRDRQYINGHRVIDPHMLTLIDWEALAFLYQDDGSLCYNNDGRPIVRLSTCSYSFFEHQALRKALIENMGLTFNINKAAKGRFQLNLSTKDMPKFFDGISNFVVDSYKYKLPESLQKGTPRTGDDLV